MTKKMEQLTKTQLESLQVATGYEMEKLHVIQSSVAKNTSPVELAYFLSVCKSSDLDPYLKEIWCYKDSKNNLIIMAGRDGFRKNAQRHPDFGGIISSVVRAKDKFFADIPNSKIVHEVDCWAMDRGEILGAYCIVARKGCASTVSIADFARYKKDYSAYSPWRTHPEAMIEKVAEVLALKKSFGLSGVQSENDFEINNDIVRPINHEFVDRTNEQIAIAQEEMRSNIEAIRSEANLLLSGVNDEDFLKDMDKRLRLSRGLAETKNLLTEINNKLDEQNSNYQSSRE